MSVKLMSRAWEMDIPQGQKMLLLALCDHANDDGLCYPAQDKLALKCSMSKRAVVSHIKWLEDHGLIVRERRQKTNVRQSNLYHINLDNYSESANSACANSACANSACANSACANSAPPKVQILHSASANSAPSYKEEPSIEPSIEPSYCNGGADAPPAAPPAVVNPPDEKTKSAKRPNAEPDPDNVRTWQAYARAYRDRYGVLPATNAKTRGQTAQFVGLVGREVAPELAAFFVWHNGGWFVQCRHDFGCLLKAYQQVLTDMQRGEQMTATKARQVERTQSNYEAVAQNDDLAAWERWQQKQGVKA